MSISEISWILSLFTIFQMAVLSNSLIGDHVCRRTENYTVTSYETYTEPVVVNTFTWCLQIPPRCPKTRTELRQRYRIKTEKKLRTIEECCKGYKILMIHDNTEANARCLPFCEKCLAGVCVAPNECQCNPGYRGNNCDRECPSGSWGVRCTEICDCGRNATCNPVSGVCECPPGQQGPRCKQHCTAGKWGSGCANDCVCQSGDNDCDAITGRCADDDASSVEQTPYTYLQSSTTELVQTPGISNVEFTEVIAAPRETTERQTEDINNNVTDAIYIPETTIPTAASTAISRHRSATNETRIRDPSTTTRPVIVLVSVPERRRDVGKDRQKYSTKDTFFEHVQGSNSIGAPKPDFVKTVHKEDITNDIQTSTPIPLDIALIVVAAIVSLGLTSVAVVMVLHMRSKLFETVRLSIYDEKAKNQEREGVNSGRISTILNASLPPPPIRPNSVFASNTEPDTVLTVDGIESLNTYANGTAMIGLRISGNLHDLLQDGHYDRPPATLIRLQTNLQHNTEHVYDEIPLQCTPLSSRKAI